MKGLPNKVKNAFFIKLWHIALNSNDNNNSNPLTNTKAILDFAFFCLRFTKFQQYWKTSFEL